MQPNKVIYHIKNDRKLTELWSQFTREEKEDVLRRMETQELADLEKVLLEIKTGQNRLF
jgi:predicted house-cleaning noncanonical NTP pyrophosphatase (MazG superfamily)